MNARVMHLSRRCSAKSKRAGRLYQAPAVKAWTACRFHGALGGGPKGARTCAYRHGLEAEEAKAERRSIHGLTGEARKLVAEPLPKDGKREDGDR